MVVQMVNLGSQFHDFFLIDVKYKCNMEIPKPCPKPIPKFRFV